jgi:hypothetical protein
MAIVLSDKEIAELISEPKPVVQDFLKKMQPKPKHGHKEAELDIVGSKGSEFRLIVRQSEFNPLDFSIILAYRLPKSNVLFRLKRFNGKSHEHTNKLEGETFYDFHIHTATERYQDSGLREDSYAEPTDRYADFHQALRVLIEDSNLQIPRSAQTTLFYGGS